MINENWLQVVFDMRNWTLIKIFVMHLSVTCACNTYTDFCDCINEDTFVKNSQESVNKTKVYEDLDDSRRQDYVTDLLDRSLRSLQITTILDKLLFDSGYDRQIRPQIEGPPLEVLG